MKQSLFVALLALLSWAGATTLSVNGQPVDGLQLSLVPGVSYAPAGPYARALGAELLIDYGSALVSLELGGRLAVLPTFSDPARAAAPGVTFHVNGEERQGTGALFWEGQLYLPVSALADAFLGYTSYVPEREQVMVVLPRGRILGLESRQRGESERLIVALGSNVPYSIFYNEALNRLEIRFERTEVEGVDAVDEGRYFSRAVALSERGVAEVRVSLGQDVDYMTYTVPDGRGYRLVVDLFRESRQPVEVEQSPLVVINAAHGGEDPGMTVEEGSESALALDLSRQLAGVLEAEGLRTRLSRSDDHDVPLQTRSGSGVGADLFLSIHVHPTDDEAVSIYYLDEASGAASLDLAIRQNAEEELAGTTDALRRRLLLNLIPDLEVGRRYASAMQGALFERSGFLIQDPQPAPLAILAGAAGRGLLLEVPPSAAQSPTFAEALAGVVVMLLLGEEP